MEEVRARLMGEIMLWHIGATALGVVVGMVGVRFLDWVLTKKGNKSIFSLD